MDLTAARRLIHEAPDTPPFSTVLLELIQAVHLLDERVDRLQIRVRELEREHEPSREPLHRIGWDLKREQP